MNTTMHSGKYPNKIYSCDYSVRQFLVTPHGQIYGTDHHFASIPPFSKLYKSPGFKHPA